MEVTCAPVWDHEARGRERRDNRESECKMTVTCKSLSVHNRVRARAYELMSVIVHNGELMTDTKQLSNIMSDMVKAKVAAQFSLVGLV